MKVRATSQIRDYLRHLHPESRRLIKDALRALGEARKIDVCPLTDELEGYYRLRVGKFRIVFRIVDDEIYCDFIDVRATVYERFTSMREFFEQGDRPVEEGASPYGKRRPATKIPRRRSPAATRSEASPAP